MRCPHCSARVVQKANDGKLKVRTSILAMGSEGVEVVCRRCGGDVPLPLEMGAELRKALESSPAQRGRLVLRRKILDEPETVS